MIELHKYCPETGQRWKVIMSETVSYLSKLKYSELVEQSETKIKQLIDEGKLPHFQSTKKYYIPDCVKDTIELIEAKKALAPECIVISIGNHKGGVLKTTNAQNISASLAFYGNRVLLIDADPQGNATKGFGIYQKNHDLVSNNTIQLMLNIKEDLTDDEFEKIIRNSIINIERQEITGRLDILPNDPKMIDRIRLLDDWANTEDSLDYILSFVRDDYDFIIIDTPPRTDTILRTCLMASDYFIISLKPEPYSSIGVPDVFAPIKAISRAYRMRKNKDLFVLGGIVGDIGSSSLHKAIIEQDNTNLLQITNNTAKVFDVQIPHYEKVGESQLGLGAMIFTDFKHDSTKAYLLLANEIVTKILEREAIRKS